MTDAQRQRLSALQDGELGDAELSSLLATLDADPALGATWERYHLIGQALRGEPIDPAWRGIAATVRPAIAPVRPASRLRRRWIGAAGAVLATAATLTVVAVLPRGSGGLPPAFPGAGSPRASAEPLATPTDGIRRWHLDRPELAGKLDLLVVTHQETLPGAGATDLLKYATLVGYEAPR